MTAVFLSPCCMHVRHLLCIDPPSESLQEATGADAPFSFITHVLGDERKKPQGRQVAQHSLKQASGLCLLRS